MRLLFSTTFTRNPSTPTVSSRTTRHEGLYGLPRDAIRIWTNDLRVLDLADCLWDRAGDTVTSRGKGRAPVHFSIDVREQSRPIPKKLREEWAVGADDVELSLSNVLHARIECVRGQLGAWVSSALLASEPSLIGRLLLETPAAVLLARRSYGVVHAGAVAGPRGAVVIRGGPGAGKSTLVAAAHAAGLGVLGDETVLVARENPDDLLAAVRDVTLLPDAAELLKLQAELVPASTRPEEKFRLDLFRSSSPAARRARRIATVVLGERNGGPARLEPLNADVFMEEFGRGEIPQEQWSGTPKNIASYWARTGAYRLSGASDLRGAVGLLSELVEHPLGAAGTGMNVLLAHSYYLRYDPKQTRKMKPYPPLSTLITAAVLRREGIPLAFFDSMLSGGVGDFANRVRDVRPSIVGILEDNFNFLTKMCTTRMREAALEMIGLAKSAGARVAVNGSDASDQARTYLDAGADAVITGETEATFPELVRRWTEDPNADLSGVPGLVLPSGPTRRRETIADLDALPLPAWDLIDVEQYRQAWVTAHGRFSWNVCASRGCPFGCNWCSKPMFGRRFTQRTPAGVAVELAELRRVVRPDHLWFADDIFGLTAPWLEAFAREVVARNAVIPFTMQSRVDLMTEAAVGALARAGCEEVWLGVESASQAVLDAMDKGSLVAEVREATRRLKHHGIRAGWFIQLGYPGEQWSDILLTRDLIREERPDDIGVSVAYPLPGTEFYDRVHAELRAKKNWSDSDDLAMMFRGAYSTDFYREIRTLLHEEVEARCSEGAVPAKWSFDAQWEGLGRREVSHRTNESSHGPRIAFGR